MLTNTRMCARTELMKTPVTDGYGYKPHSPRLSHPETLDGRDKLKRSPKP